MSKNTVYNMTMKRPDNYHLVSELNYEELLTDSRRMLDDWVSNAQNTSGRSERLLVLTIPASYYLLTQVNSFKCNQTQMLFWLLALAALLISLVYSACMLYPYNSATSSIGVEDVFKPEYIDNPEYKDKLNTFLPAMMLLYYNININKMIPVCQKRTSLWRYQVLWACAASGLYFIALLLNQSINPCLCK